LRPPVSHTARTCSSRLSYTPSRAHSFQPIVKRMSRAHCQFLAKQRKPRSCHYGVFQTFVSHVAHPHPCTHESDKDRIITGIRASAAEGFLASARILAICWAWIALADTSDPYHRKLKSQHKKLGQGRRRYVTSDYVLSEPITFLYPAIGAAHAQNFLNTILASAHAGVTSPADPVNNCFAWAAGYSVIAADVWLSSSIQSPSSRPARNAWPFPGVTGVK
jgi:hypothetical protein